MPHAHVARCRPGVGTTSTLLLLDGRSLRFALRLKVQQLPALLFDLPAPPLRLALSLRPFKLCQTSELAPPASIRHLLLALHMALPGLGAAGAR